MTRDTVRKDREGREEGEGGRIAQGRKSDRIKEVGPFQRETQAGKGLLAINAPHKKSSSPSLMGSTLPSSLPRFPPPLSRRRLRRESKPGDQGEHGEIRGKQRKTSS